MADEELVAELAEHLRQRFWHEIPTWKAVGETVLAWLAERGRLVPDGAQVAEEWGTRHHFQSGATTDTRFGSRDDASSDVLLGRVAAGLPTTLIRRQVITGLWVAVDEETT